VSAIETLRLSPRFEQDQAAVQSLIRYYVTQGDANDLCGGEQSHVQASCTVTPTRSKDIFMGKYQIAVIVGSLRRDSFIRKLAKAMAKLAPSEFSFKQEGIGDLPLYSE
jgi:hypothetical protein